MAHLRLTSGPYPGQSIPLKDGLTIGRSSSSDVYFDEQTLSRQHARLEMNNGTWAITDLGSANGTFVNGTPVRNTTAIQDGDDIGLGSLLFKFDVDPKRPVGAGVDVTWDPPGGGTRILENVPEADQIEPLLPSGLGKDATRLMVKRLRLLSKFAAALGNVIEAERLFPLVLEKLLHAFPDAERGCVMLCDPDGSNLHAAAAVARPGAKRQISVSRTVAKQVIDTRSALLSADVSGDERFDARHTMVRFGLRSVMCAPMVCENTVLGLIQLDSSNPRHQFSKADMALFLGIAGHTALALSKARLHERLVAQMILQKDLQMAERIQHCFLPKAPPKKPGFRFAGSYSAAQHVGGDYYDFVDISDNAMGIVVGDVAGKGVAAALYMARLSSEMRYHARGCLSAGAVLSALNRELTMEMESGMFVTMALLVLEPEKRKITMSSAGHPAPILRTPDGTVSELQIKGNIPLGVLEDYEYGETEYALKSGDLVLLYTDGITEAMSSSGEMFGAARLKEVVSSGGQDPRQVLASISRSVEEHAAGHPQSDDLTMVCFAVD